ncbi:MAG: efflux RND transporter periplasmic adaptor subunit [Bacteroidetes bacterium]|uniref:Efflux RND transporter periplasmic adaptor subunit n=1 Tax=Phaeocystidibacter marisrubri TaxID=1577780 RepID=A0A6L3ZH47_9FLAO|nr:efflux RND transporter periplasmic adaptor subunit [Phaeocystidibacter marisrubri]KAB2816943.1 efflux RND transporter periplasmic adaptor subunit [Phaeocystidibacter marisrubri]TNE27579.1 MAG: efflux RND transporter periplasmic adaptor subunit [Bacteroidota bacterium]GGH77497.1 RND transporter [Phaeocystidibacter marisrubri]
MKNRKSLFIVLGIVLVVVLLVVARVSGAFGEPEGLEVEVGVVTKRTLVETASASGKIQPEVEVKLSPEVSGEIIALPVVEGQYVEAGQLLVSINPDLYRAAVNRTQASVNASRSALAQAKAQFVEAEKSYRRNENLFKQNVISQAEWDAAQRAYSVSELSVESAEYQLQSAQATLREAQDNLKRTTITAPVSGTISALNVELGERVVGTAQMAGTELLRIANLNDMEVLVEVNENDIVKVALNDTADIEVDAYLGEKYLGVVTEIANSANTNGTSADQVTNFEVKVRILRSSYAPDSEEQPFRPGMTASVDIRTNRREGILTVPIEAVTVREDTSSTGSRPKFSSQNETEEKEEFEVVFAPDNGKAKIIVVKTGIQDERFIEILEGLSDGQEIIVGSYEAVAKKLNAGDAIVSQSSGGSKDEGEK